MDRFYTSPVHQIFPEDFSQLLDIAIQEDCPTVDITTESIFQKGEIGKAHLNSRENGILCGISLLEAVSDRFPNEFSFQTYCNDGNELTKGMKIAELTGSLIVLLRMERIVLNFLQYLSGIASTTNSLVKKYPNLMILDTRKTLPGYRKLVKYAVYTGGGANHRLNLSDMGLIKDNHIAFCGSIKDSVSRIRNKFPDKKIELEIDDLNQLDEAIESNPNIIMLDNFSNSDTIIAIKKVSSKNDQIKIECSGGITPEKLEFLSKFEGIGVSMGYLTHTTKFLDLGLDIERL
jgi:nicotinate-nucleotide pyrophosphorylase (carboxylating)